DEGPRGTVPGDRAPANARAEGHAQLIELLGIGVSDVIDVRVEPPTLAADRLAEIRVQLDEGAVRRAPGRQARGVEQDDVVVAADPELEDTRPAARLRRTEAFEHREGQRPDALVAALERALESAACLRQPAAPRLGEPQ